MQATGKNISAILNEAQDINKQAAFIDCALIKVVINTKKMSRPIELISSTDAKLPASFEYRSPAYVIDTDYTNYAILWACQSNLINGLMRRENIWILSRTKTLDPSMKKSLIDRLRGKTYASYFLMPTDQTNCK